MKYIYTINSVGISLPGLTREGIYRVPGFRAKLNELKTMYNRGN